LIFCSGLAYSAPTLFIRAMMADAADEADLDQGRPATGMLYALISSTAKISSALAIFITFAVLGAIGFAPKAHAHNSAEALFGLQALFVGVPAISALLGALVLRRYSIDQGRHAEIRRGLDARGALIKAPARLKAGRG
jgi:GPH family glycoside/pentoside/hexuronide:cation symporter